jgi:hypothetical protein
MQITVVEPHSDDAFLSVGGHVERWVKEGRKVTILTIVPTERHSLRDAENYARAVGAEWVGFEDFPGGADCSWENLVKPVIAPGLLILPLGAAPLSQGESNSHTGDHYQIRKWLETPSCLYYLDQPYALIQKNGERVNELMRGMTVESYLKPPARKWRHVPLFTAQAKFFHYNEKFLPQITELLVRKIGKNG